VFRITVHTLIFSSLLLASCPADAIESTWTGLGTDSAWTNSGSPSNWTNGIPGLTGQSDVATFSGSVAVTNPTINQGQTISLSALNFDSTATSYTINASAAGDTGNLFLYGAGIVNNSSNPQYINIASTGNVYFHNNSTAGNVIFFNSGGIYFGYEPGYSSTAGNSTIYNTSYVYFGNDGGASGGTGRAGNSTIISNGAATGVVFGNGGGVGGIGYADNSTIINNGGSINTTGNGVVFGLYANDIGYANNSTIINNGGGTVSFGASPGAQGFANNSTITNNNGSVIYFGLSGGTGYANNSRITNNAGGEIDFGYGGLGYADSSAITNNAGAHIFFYTLTDAGQATLVNSGTLDISNAPSGSLTIGRLSGGATGAILLGANNLSEGSLNTNDVYAGSISGSGGVTKVGTGIWALTGNSNYSGPTSVTQGALAILGNLSGVGATTVNTGATLALIGGSIMGDVSSAGTVNGYGTIGGNVINSGLLSSGETTNPLNVGGNYTQHSNGTYNVNIQGAHNHMLNVTGAASLNGTLALNLLQEPDVKANYTIVQAASGVTGSFSGIDWGLSGRPFLQGAIQYNPANVDVVYKLNPATMLSDAVTPNQQAVAHYVLNTNPPQNVANAIGALATSSQYQQALGELSGSLNAQLGSAAYDAQHRFDGIVGKRLGGDCNQMGEQQKMGDGAAWACGYGDIGHIGSGSNATSVNSSLYGFATGYEFTPGDANVVRAGIGYGQDFIRQNAILGDNATLNSYQAGVYAQHTIAGGFYVGGGISGAYNTADTTRTISFGGLDATAKGTPDGYNMGASAVVGYEVKPGNGLKIEPVAGLEYIYNHQNGFSESGGGSADLLVDSKSSSSLRSSIGTQLSKAIALDNGMTLTPEGRAAFLYDAMTVAPSVDEAFAGNSAFSVRASDPGRAGVQAGAGVTLNVKSNLSLFADYTGTVKNNESDNSFLGGLKYTW
jgi:fibronectin-binding autotransporter adhesin